MVGMKLDYEGEIDSNGNACGHGIATRPGTDKSGAAYLEIEGTWLGGMKHGFCKFIFPELTFLAMITTKDVRLEGEYKFRWCHGKSTLYKFKDQ